ncbi:kinase-like domain-containing protein [Lineolata rhizophorae]|uniref:non-specific serine/threonine protein kinase n=1 Tax=Lineolata rhizophorae TaxID=578093 RepID=A0A6A6NM00_9PEZI|nr:kinase-like domain-containing protein [Lineolata rhizophorae]
MTDPDIILYLYPNDGPGKKGAKEAISMPENQSRYMPPRRRDALEQHDIPSRQDRESTEQPEEQRGLENSACLVLRFSHGAKTRLGVVAGCAANVDLPLRKQAGISRFHLTFTFDDKDRPIVRDLGSLCGTRVIYNGEEGERRSNFDYLLQGPRILGNKPPVLNVTNKVQFKVVVPPRDITSQDYIGKVARFRQGTADPEDLFASLVLRSAPGTQPPTGEHTVPRLSDPSLYKKKLGEGAFGVVTYLECDDWGRDHIVAFRDATFSPWPRLTFEYVPGGSLDTYINLSTFENVQVLRQLLSALRYLHGQNPPIGHRDIKPENILVLYRRSSGIYVKFADFGLAKAADYLKTCCGSLLWAAPEIYNKIPDPEAAADVRYSVAVDIWSLGVVIASRECGLPYYEESYQTSTVAWIRAVLQHVEDYEEKGNGLLYFLLDTMLVVDPQERKRAPYCHDEALRLSNCDSRQPFLHRISRSRLNGHTSSDTNESDEDSDLGTPTPSIPGIQPSMGHEGASEESTIRLGPRADGLRTPAETTAASIDPSLIANLGYRGTDMINSIVNSTESGTPQGSGASTPNAQLSQGQANSAVLPQGSVLDSVLWNPEPAGFSSNHDAAATEAGGPQNDARPEELDVFFLIRYHLGGGAQDNEAQEAVEVSEVTAGEPRQPGRKRTWLEDRSPLMSAHRSHTDPTPGLAAPQRDNTVGRDGSSSRILRAGKRRKSVATGEDPESG